MKIDPRFLTEEGPQIFNGNELLIKGCLEAEGGVHLLGGYPGSPVSGFFDSMAYIKDLLNEKGIRAVINHNEALAAAMLNGSQVAGLRGVICMKSVGVHVAADALALGSLAGAHPDGGAVVIYGDDPWSDSTQVPADSRYISRHLFIPTLEPSNAQEIKDFLDLGLKLSRRSELYAGYIVATNLADGGGTVRCRANQYPAVNTHAQMDFLTGGIDLNKFVLLPPKTWWQEAKYAERFERCLAVSRELGLNRLENAAQRRAPVGFVTSGLAYAYLAQALDEMGLGGAMPVLKFGLTYPLDERLVEALAAQCERIVVVEERRGFLEEQIAEALTRLRQSGKVTDPVELWGKTFPEGLAGIPEIRGLHPSILTERLGPLLQKVGGSAVSSAAAKAIESELRTIEQAGKVRVPQMPPRLPTFCPGCPHRDSSDLCLEIQKRFRDAAYMKRRHGRGPVDLVFHGDIGCYTMLMFPPNTSLMHNLSGMGLGGGTGAGMDPFITNKQVVFMGDSTFFHCGQIAISQAVKLGQDITFIILDNRTTGMTGHQPTPGLEYDVIGNLTAVQDIEEIVRAFGSQSELPLYRVDPEKRDEYGQLLERTFLADGVKVIIADKECGITRTRRKRREERAKARTLGYLPSWQHMNINPEICRFCLSCAEMTGCPGLKHSETDYGRKMDTDITWCVDDGACERIGACSSFERVTIRRTKPPRTRVPELGLDQIPEPARREVGDVWRCALAGVGGMGVGLATSILVRAGHMEGYEVVFVDKKGLAIRNGGTVSQVVYNIARRPVTALIPYGKADVLLGVDVLEAARSLDPRQRLRLASPERTSAVINLDKITTIRGLFGEEDFDVEELEQAIRAGTRTDDYLARNISRICEKYLGSKLYANIMMLGFAFQKGLIPVSMHSIAWGIKDTIRADVRKNLYAFNMGRKLCERMDIFQGPPQRTGWRETLEERCRNTIRRYRDGEKLAAALRELAAGTIEAAGNLDEADRRALVVRIYDCLRWGGIEYARRYARRVTEIARKDSPRFGLAATRAVVYDLADAMLIKDGVFLAELSTSPEKYARDREKYNVNPANGDRIVYRHFWHPTLKLGPWQWRPRVTFRNSTLKLLRTMRWLRKALPRWHRAEKQYLAAYEAAVDAFRWTTPAEYRAGVALIASRECMNCLNPRCKEQGCPLANEIPTWVQLAYRDRWQEAAEMLLARNNFPEITSRICPALCEKSCKQALEGDPVGVQALERQVAERALAEGWDAPRPAARKTGRAVAVIGSGPAGLAAAQQLARAGHRVTVFEKEQSPGGLLRYGIPAWRLEKTLIDARVEQLRAEGVEFRTGVEVGAGVSGAELRGQYDAVLLAVGAARPRDLRVPGRDKQGVMFGVDFLRDQARGAGAADAPAPARGKSVVVIGGGLTGEDCVETAVAQGAAQVHQLEILPESPVSESCQAGQLGEEPNVTRRWSVATEALEGDDGVQRLRARQVRWAPSPAGSRMEPVDGGQFVIDADLVLLAMGFDAALPEALAKQLGLALDAAGRTKVRDFATDQPGVFAAGDLATGASYVVTAIDSGRKAAEKIDRFLAALPAKASKV
ncbi:MAG TPA: indolepyruvate ferredoxin oxidoreductase [Phycisphaerales bacterium]|nr:indolepyruvate ferredoxin oxidoreductase [Phycisphaerales bacterium]